MGRGVVETGFSDDSLCYVNDMFIRQPEAGSVSVILYVPHRMIIDWYTVIMLHLPLYENHIKCEA